MMVWGHGFFAKTMIPDHHAVQISFIKRQQPLPLFENIAIFPNLGIATAHATTP